MERPLSLPPRAPQPRWRQLAPLLALALVVACSGGQGCSGCGGMGFAPIKGGFPIDKRKENAIELRLSKGLFDFVSAVGPSLVRQFLPMGGIPIPSSCGGDTQICCGQSCRLALDVTSIGFAPQPPSTTRIQLRSRLRTLEDMRVKIKRGIINFDCRVSFDSGRRGRPDIGITAALVARVDAQTRLTSLEVPDNSIDIQDIDNDDIDIDGGFACEIVDFLKGLFTNTLKNELKKQVAPPLNNALCQKCMSKDDCSTLANQGCSDKKYCMRDGVCMQQLGVEGRLALGGLLGGLSPSAKGSSLDLYAVAGGYADVENGAGGLSLGMLGGGLTTTRSACVPERPAPAGEALPKAAALTANQTPNGKPFHVGLGLSTVELDTLGHAFYETGSLCLSIGTPQVALLSSGTLTTLVRSLEDLTRGQPASVFIAMRPQQPPTFALGKGTYKMDGMGRRVIDDPLLKINVKDFALDFYLYLDERYVRFMRLTADVSVPLGLDVDNMNRLVPILGDLGQALGNIRVSDTALLKEPPEMLAALFPKLLPVLLAQVNTTIKPIELPKIMNFTLKPVQFASLDGRPGRLDFLGLFFELGVSGMGLREDGALLASAPPEPAETTAELLALDVPGTARIMQGQGPRAVLRVDGRGSGSLEWQYAVDGGLWRPFDDGHELVVDDAVLGLPGRHHVEVRARVVGAPETLDPTPARVEFDVRPAADLEWHGQDFHGRVGDGAAGGCSSCSIAGRAQGGAAGGVFTALFAGVLLLLLGRRRLRPVLARWDRRALPRALALLLLPAAAQLQACADTKVEEPPAAPGEQFAESDEIGRYQSAIGRGEKIYVSAYNSTWGDLAFGSTSGADTPIAWRVVDGLPDGAPTDATPNAPRRGHTEPGADVGRFTSLGFTSGGNPVIAYQDATAGAVKLAVGSATEWKVSVVAEPAPGGRLGLFTQLSLGGGDVPTVAYMATGLRREGGKVASQLVVAQASTSSPAGPGDWTKKVVEEVEIPCAGFCSATEACVAEGPKKDPQPSVCKPTSGGCTGCKTGQACVEDKCQDVLVPPPAGIPEGTGLYLRLLRDGDNVTVVFHNRTTGALKMAAGPEFVVKAIDGGDGKVDVGQHLGAALGEGGVLHVAYVDAVTDQLLYREVRDGTPGMREMVDDGQRGTGAAREQHAVGAGALLFLDGGAPKVAYQDQTAGTLELATRGPNGWSHETKAPGGTKSRGYYPQAVRLGSQWILLDVTYDRARDVPLTAVELSPL